MESLIFVMKTRAYHAKNDENRLILLLQTVLKQLH